MNLAVDIGNSSAKAALFGGGRIVRVFHGVEDLPSVHKTIVVSTRGDVDGFEGALRLDHTTPVPIKNLYSTPETLGYDRLAAAVGAFVKFPGKAVLIVDFGTAITYDIVTAAGEFLGGNISPGAGSRFRALHDYTGRLPLGGLPCSRDAESPTRRGFPSRNTKDAVENGVVFGIIAETEYYIDVTKREFGEIKVIFTGGDADYFVKRVKYPIFATSELVFYGLNAILEHNANL